MIDFWGLFRFIFSGLPGPRDNVLYPFEKAYFSELFDQLGPKARAKLEQQLNVINRIHRLNRGKMVDVFTIKYGKSAFPKNLILNGLGDDIELFKAEIRKSELSNSILNVKVFIVLGRIFEFQYSDSPISFFEGSPNTDQFFVGRIKLLIDLTSLEEAAG